MTPNTADRMRELFAGVFGPGGTVRHFMSPGRVNIIGEHLDYNGGYVFPAALSLGIQALVRYHDGPQIKMRSTAYPDERIINLENPIVNDGSGGWWNYPAGVIRHLTDSGHGFTGADILFDSSLPEGAGLSSSAAIEVLTACVMLRGEPADDGERIRIAVLCKNVENRFIGVQCGIMDQFAVAMGKKDHAILLKSDTLAYSRVPFNLNDHSLVIMNTNKPRKLSGSKYNERRAECDRALAEISKRRPIGSLAEATMPEIEELADDILRRRARHVVSENSRVLASVDLLKKNDLPSFGMLMTESHRSLRDDYDVTGFELDALVSASMDTDGCIGARMTGAGFGGCAIALVKSDKTDKFIESAGAAYKKTSGIAADFYITDVADGVREIPGQ